MNNLTIQVYFSSHFPDYFNNMNCSLCIDQNRLKTDNFECFALRMRVSVKYQWQLLKYHNMCSVSVSTLSLINSLTTFKFLEGLTWLHILVINMLAPVSIRPGHRCRRAGLKIMPTLPLAWTIRALDRHSPLEIKVQ